MPGRIPQADVDVLQVLHLTHLDIEGFEIARLQAGRGRQRLECRQHANDLPVECHGEGMRDAARLLFGPVALRYREAPQQHGHEQERGREQADAEEGKPGF